MKALITNPVHNSLILNLETQKIVVDYIPDISLSQVDKRITAYDIIVVNSNIPMTKNRIDKAKRLKVIGRLGSGMEHIDVSYAKKKNICVVSSPEGNSNAVGEHALSMLLCVMNKLILANKEVVFNKWDRETCRGDELKGKTVAIIGFGNTGKAFAKVLRGFDVQILYYDIIHISHNISNASASSLSEIKEKADVLSFHVPYNKETHHYFSNLFLDQMEKPFYLINTSRGSVVDTSILLKGIESAKIKGLCLDVFENENPSTFNEENKKWFKSLNNTGKVVFSPHVAGWTIQSKELISKILYQKILSCLNNM